MLASQLEQLHPTNHIEGCNDWEISTDFQQINFIIDNHGIFTVGAGLIIKSPDLPSTIRSMERESENHVNDIHLALTLSSLSSRQEYTKPVGYSQLIQSISHPHKEGGSK